MHASERNMESTNDLAYTTEEVATLLRTHRNKIDQLRKNGLISGIKLGKGFIYAASEVQSFLDRYAGEDLSNEQAMLDAKSKRERRSN
jgi:excisionase family DNA binding protein